jgi:hypothetical protein
MPDVPVDGDSPAELTWDGPLGWTAPVLEVMVVVTMTVAPAAEHAVVASVASARTASERPIRGLIISPPDVHASCVACPGSPTRTPREVAVSPP